MKDPKIEFSYNHDNVETKIAVPAETTLDELVETFKLFCLAAGYHSDNVQAISYVHRSPWENIIEDEEIECGQNYEFNFDEVDE